MRYEIFQRERRGDHQYVAAHFWESARDRRRSPALTNDFKLHLPKAFTAARDEVIDAELRAYAARAFSRGWHGDRRGTTSVYQVAAGADDGWIDDIAGFDDNDVNVLVGCVGASAAHGWYRFTGVSGLAGATINSAVLSLYGETVDAGSPQTLLFLDQQTSPTNPGSEADYAGRTTGLSVGWSPPSLSTSGWTDSPELSTLVQEIINNVGTPSALLVLHKNEGVDGGEYCYPWSYDGDSAKAAKLTIDSSLPVLPVPPQLRRSTPRPVYRR